MSKISLIYWSGTGNTEAMANLIKEGILSTGNEVELKTVGSASVSDVEGSDIVILGSPAMGAEVLEEDEMEPFVESLKAVVSGKKVGLFGSYDWGDGEWMRNWEERMKSYGAEVYKEGLIVNGEPDGDSAEACKNFGKEIVG